MNNLQLPSLRRTRRSQRGAVSLLVALMLLLGGTIMAFFANRSFIFEQRTSANQYRATKAFELAEGGVEWAMGKFNESGSLVAGTSCAAGGSPTDTTFRDRYSGPVAGAGGNPGSLTLPPPFPPPPSPPPPLPTQLMRCRIDNVGVATCDCQTVVGTFANLGTADSDQGHFGVRFAAVPGDSASVEIIARGCTQGDAVCDPDPRVSSTADANAVVRVIAKVVPTLPGGPAAPLTAGSVAAAAGSTLTVFNDYVPVFNSDPPSSYITVHSGAGVQTGAGITVYSVPGSPSSASIVDDDPMLSGMTLAAEDTRFASFSGQTLTNYSTVDPGVIRIGSCSAASCGAQVMTHINNGVRQPRFFVDGDITFDSSNVGGNPIGTAINPVVIVSNGTVAIGASATAHGLFHAAAVTVDGTGTSTIRGAVISRGDFRNRSGTLNLIYDPSGWSASAAPMGRLVKVPGSWRDKATNF